MNEYTECSSTLKTLLGSYDGNIWEVDEIMEYIDSLQINDKNTLKKEMEYIVKNSLSSVGFLTEAPDIYDYLD